MLSSAVHGFSSADEPITNVVIVEPTLSADGRVLVESTGGCGLVAALHWVYLGPGIPQLLGFVHLGVALAVATGASARVSVDFRTCERLPVVRVFELIFEGR